MKRRKLRRERFFHKIVSADVFFFEKSLRGKRSVPLNFMSLNETLFKLQFAFFMKLCRQELIADNSKFLIGHEKFVSSKLKRITC